MLRRREPLLGFAETLEALGSEGEMGTYDDDVELTSIAGSVARVEDFDHRFRPRDRGSDRLRNIRNLVGRGTSLPRVDLVRLGDLYFVVDGHHRVAVAVERGWVTIPARVRRICTVAFARCCLRRADLAASTAERRFLEALPLPDDVRREARLDDPADWARLRDAAQAWGFRRQLEDGSMWCCAHDLASAWWVEEVQPLVGRLRQGGGPNTSGVLDLQLYVTALAQRDRLGELDWDDPLNVDAACW
jgi:hypothetical protein